MAEISNQNTVHPKIVKYETQHLIKNNKKSIFLTIFNYFSG